MARNHFELLDTAADVRRFVALGRLVPIEGNRDYELHNVSFAVGRPELRMFVERLGAQYHRACGERLVVTSLTRPKSRQPTNAYSHSLHRTGMAVDVRRSSKRRCRSWIEKTLRSLEKKHVLEATAEHHPPHYHVAVFPQRYAEYVGISPEPSVKTATTTTMSPTTHRIERGDTLWAIAHKYHTTIDRLIDVNSLDGSAIAVGQSLKIPGDT